MAARVIAGNRPVPRSGAVLACPAGGPSGAAGEADGQPVAALSGDEGIHELALKILAICLIARVHLGEGEPCALSTERALLGRPLQSLRKCLGDRRLARVVKVTRRGDRGDELGSLRGRYLRRAEVRSAADLRSTISTGRKRGSRLARGTPRNCGPNDPAAAPLAAADLGYGHGYGVGMGAGVR